MTRTFQITVTVLALLFGVSASSAATQVSREIDVAEVRYVNVRPTAHDAAAAFNGSIYLVTWTDCRAKALGGYALDRQEGDPDSCDVYGARVDLDGTVLDPTGFPLSTAAGGQSNTDVASNGSGFYVTWTHEPDVDSSLELRGTQVSADGVVTNPGGDEIASGIDFDPAGRVASNGNGYVAVWHELEPNTEDADVRGRVVGASGDLGQEKLAIATAPGRQSSPAIAWGGGAYTVAWEGSTVNDSHVYTARLTPSGDVTEALRVTDEEGAVRGVALAWDGSVFLATWNRRESFEGVYGVEAVRLDAAGSPIDANPLWYAEGGITPAISSVDGTFLVTWTHDLGTNTDVRATRITDTGIVLDPQGQAIDASPDRDEGSSDVTSDGEGFLVLWGDPERGVAAAFVSPLGTVSPEQDVVKAAIDQNRPTIAWGGGQYLAVWEDYRGGAYSTFGSRDLYATRLTANGRSKDGAGFVIAQGDGSHGHPQVAWNGTNFIVVWESLSDYQDGSPDLYATAVTPDGMVLTPSGTLIEEAARDAVVSARGGAALVLWSRERLGTGYDVQGGLLGPTGSRLEAEDMDVAATNLTEVRMSAAAGGNGFLVAWTSARGSSPGDIFVRGRRVGSDGTMQRIRRIAGPGAATPVVTRAGARFHVGWITTPSRRLAGRFVSRGGMTRVRKSRFSVGTEAFSTLRSAWDGRRAVLAWNKGKEGQNADVLAVRVRRGGRFPNAPLRVAVSREDEVAVAVAGGRDQAAVVYMRPALEKKYGGALRVFLRLISP